MNGIGIPGPSPISFLDDLPAATLAKLDEQWLDESGSIKLLPAATFKAAKPAHLQVWCYKRARYVVVTQELVEWLTGVIGSRKAIEVAAGMGDLGSHLNIPMTDSYMQVDDPFVALFYQKLNTPPTKPPDCVEKIDANAAVKKHKPQVVVAGYLTRRFIIGVDVPGESQASMAGADEEEIISSVETYIHIGNDLSHGSKTALSLPHSTYRFDWLVTRSPAPSRNVMYVWQQQNKPFIVPARRARTTVVVA